MEHAQLAERHGAFPAVGDRWMPASADCPNALTCDVEDYFQVSAFEKHVSKADWLDFECRIPRNIDRILSIYDDAGVHGTFFILGWVAEHFPDVVRRIAQAGHEIASHGMVHSRVWDLGAEGFFRDVDEAKRRLEDVSGEQVNGFRAASWSLDVRTPWAHELLEKAGYVYSSSIYPVARDHYGVPNAPAYPFFVSGLDLLEIPATSVRILGQNRPAAGGGFFRLLPYSVSKLLLRRSRRASGNPAIFYFHPWEIDPEQPRITGIGLKTRVRHYLNLDAFEARLGRLLQDFRWDRMDRIYLEATHVG